MRAPRDQHVDVHLPRERCEHLPVAARHDLLPVRETYPERLVRDRERERVMRVLPSAIINVQAAAAAKRRTPHFTPDTVSC